MTPRSEESYRERPPAGECAWPNNGDLYERMRCSLLVEADKAEAEGDSAKADDLRGQAAFQRRERDRCWREHERRMLNRRIHRGTF